MEIKSPLFALGQIMDLAGPHHGMVVGPEFPEDHLAFHDRLFLQYWGQPPWTKTAFDPGFQKELTTMGRNTYFVLRGILDLRAYNGEKSEQIFALLGGEYIVLTNNVISGIRGRGEAYGFRVYWPEPINTGPTLHHDLTANLENRFNQWLAGHFLERENHPLATRRCELKRWHYAGELDYPPKTFGGEREFITVEAGELEFIFPDGQLDPIRVKAGQYFVLRGGIAKVVKVIQFPSFGLTLRWPSVSNINQVAVV